MLHTDSVEPGRLYALGELPDLIPSCYAGKRVSTKTLHRWRVAGKLACVRIGKGYFVAGSEILKILGDGVQFQGRTPGKRQAAADAAMERIRRMRGS